MRRKRETNRRRDTDNVRNTGRGRHREEKRTHTLHEKGGLEDREIETISKKEKKRRSGHNINGKKYRAQQ